MCTDSYTTLHKWGAKEAFLHIKHPLFNGNYFWNSTKMGAAEIKLINYTKITWLKKTKVWSFNQLIAQFVFLSFSISHLHMAFDDSHPKVYKSVSHSGLVCIFFVTVWPFHNIIGPPIYNCQFWLFSLLELHFKNSIEWQDF